MNEIIKKSLFCILVSPLTVMAAGNNPYDEGWGSVINDAKWQLGDDGDDVCKNTDCEAVLNQLSNRNYLSATSSTSLKFSTDGSEDEPWRNELRFEDSFSRSSSEKMELELRSSKSSTTSTQFTVAQLHMEGAEGPVARLEIIDEKEYTIVFRLDPDCKSSDKSCLFTHETFSADPNKTQDVKFETKSSVLSVSVDGETYSFDMSSKWPNEEKYYWKTGVYLQEDGVAVMLFTDIDW